MNLPNVLTLCRFALIPVYLVIFLYGYVKISFLILLVAGLTDILDGYMARRRKQTTQMGAMLDPLADKSMMITVILSMLFAGRIPWQAAAAMFFRDLGMIVSSGYVYLRGKRTIPANWMGKLSTALYYPAILFIVFDYNFAIPYLWCVIFFSFVTSFMYILRYLKKEHIYR